MLGRAGVDIGMGMGMGSGRIKCVLAITKGTLSGVMAAGRLSGYSGPLVGRVACHDQVELVLLVPVPVRPLECKPPPHQKRVSMCARVVSLTLSCLLLLEYRGLGYGIYISTSIAITSPS